MTVAARIGEAGLQGWREKLADGVKQEAALREIAKRGGHVVLFCTSAAWKGGIQKLNVSEYAVMEDGN